MFSFDAYPFLNDVNEKGAKARIVEKMAKAERDGGLLKTWVADLNSDLNRILDTAWDRITRGVSYDRSVTPWKAVYKDVELSKVEDGLRYGILYAHGVKGLIRKLDKDKKQTAFGVDALAFLRDFEPLIDQIKAVKIIAREPKVDPVLAYVAPPASQKAARAVYDLLSKLTQNNFENLVRFYYESKQRMVESFMAQQAKPVEDGKKTISIREHCSIKIDQYYTKVIVEREDVLSIAFGRDKIYDHKVLVKLPDADALLEKAARAEAEYMNQTFIYKNMSKMDSIVEKHEGFDRAFILSQSNHLLEGETRVMFKNGDAFTARTSIVHAYSVHGVPFARYPLTFHQVVKNGKRNAMFSEKQMNEEFAKTA